MFKWLCENSDPKVHSEVLNYVIEIFKTLFLTMVSYFLILFYFQ